MLAALEHRHRRYIKLVTSDLPAEPKKALSTLFDRIGDWMAEEASHGCLFHAAVAAAPGNRALRDMLVRHKREVSEALGEAIALPDRGEDLMLLVEGLTQSWPLSGRGAVESAKRFAGALLDRAGSARTAVTSEL